MTRLAGKGAVLCRSRGLSLGHLRSAWLTSGVCVAVMGTKQRQGVSGLGVDLQRAGGRFAQVKGQTDLGPLCSADCLACWRCFDDIEPESGSEGEEQKKEVIQGVSLEFPMLCFFTLGFS